MIFLQRLWCEFSLYHRLFCGFSCFLNVSPPLSLLMWTVFITVCVPGDAEGDGGLQKSS